MLDESHSLPLFTLIQKSRDFLAAHLPWPNECASQDDVLNRLDSWDLQASMGNGACWGIFEKMNGHENLAGCIILGWIELSHASAKVSYWLGESYTGRGLATDALKLLCAFCFETLKLNRLELSAAVDNPKSAAVACRAGFAEEGLCREFERINGIFVDHIRFSRLARD